MGKQLKCNHSTQEITMGKFCGRNTHAHTHTSTYGHTTTRWGLPVCCHRTVWTSFSAFLFVFVWIGSWNVSTNVPGGLGQRCIWGISRWSRASLLLHLQAGAFFFLSRQDGATHSTPLPSIPPSCLVLKKFLLLLRCLLLFFTSFAWELGFGFSFGADTDTEGRR